MHAYSSFFFFNDTATTEIYTLSLHDALPISRALPGGRGSALRFSPPRSRWDRSEEHTSELQSHSDLVCRLLLEKKKILSSSSICTRMRASKMVSSAAAYCILNIIGAKH